MKFKKLLLFAIVTNSFLVHKPSNAIDKYTLLKIASGYLALRALYCAHEANDKMAKVQGHKKIQNEKNERMFFLSLGISSAIGFAYLMRQNFISAYKQINAINFDKKNVLKVAKILSGLSSAIGFVGTFYFDIAMKKLNSKLDFIKREKNETEKMVRSELVEEFLKEHKDNKFISLMLGIFAFKAFCFFNYFDK